MTVVLILAIIAIVCFAGWRLYLGRQMQCRNCGHYLYDRMERCPHCGCRVMKEEILPEIRRKDQK